MGFCEFDVGLSNAFAVVATESSHCEFQFDGFAADGHGAIGACDEAATDDVVGSARGTAIMLRILFEVDGDDSVFANSLCDVVVANAESIVE